MRNPLNPKKTGTPIMPKRVGLLAQYLVSAKKEVPRWWARTSKIAIARHPSRVEMYAAFAPERPWFSVGPTFICVSINLERSWTNQVPSTTSESSKQPVSPELYFDLITSIK
jgi:hypothetical protein